MYGLTGGCNVMGNIMVALNFHVSKIGYREKFSFDVLFGCRTFQTVLTDV